MKRETTHHADGSTTVKVGRFGEQPTHATGVVCLERDEWRGPDLLDGGEIISPGVSLIRRDFFNRKVLANRFDRDEVFRSLQAEQRRIDREHGQIEIPRSVRSKTDAAMKYEVLCKFLCHNLCCLISAFRELGIGATFWN